MLLNLDAGERDDESPALWQEFDLLAIACGGHAGTAATMSRVITWCMQHDRRIAAHPSYPDREGFGRRSIAIAPEALAASLHGQFAALVEIAQHHGGAIEWIKPHGALYHDANRDPVIARGLLRIAIEVLGPVGVIGPPTGGLRDVAESFELPYAREGFADRRLAGDDTLVPRGETGAVIDDPATAAAQARELATRVDTICIHADSPNALAIARAVRAAVR
ncbi:MAG: LamB/YcsF family protein [Kofleriaceae bacterium]